MFKAYINLTKPGIIFGNALTAISGFALASNGQFNVFLFLAMLVGLSCVVASGCVWNNYLDRVMDEKMVRTKDRVLVKKVIPVQHALSFGMALSFLGIGVLSIFTNLLTVTLAACGFFIYVVLYSLSKYRTSLATLIGSVSGAIPPVIGYTAVSGHIDLAAAILFLIVTFWQMPHFYAIAMYRYDDYTRASIPVLPVAKGMFAAKIQSFLYIFAFIGAALSLTYFGYTGYNYLAVMSVLGAAWLYLALDGFITEDTTSWARKMFFFSLAIIMAFTVMTSFDGLVRP